MICYKDFGRHEIRYHHKVSCMHIERYNVVLGLRLHCVSKRLPLYELPSEDCDNGPLVLKVFGG